MDRRLRTDLQSIAQDHTSGSAELALRALIAVQRWLRRQPKCTEAQFPEAATALFQIQPSMAPMLRLANEVALAADQRERRRHLQNTLSEFRRVIETGPAEVAKNFIRARGRGRPWRVVTYSYSSTVSRALGAAASQIKEVTCSEGRPALEGRRMASELALAGITVWFLTDAMLLESPEFRTDCLLLGADAVMRGGFVLKAGAGRLVESFLQARKRVWILADTSKFWPEGVIGPSYLHPTWGPTDEIWGEPPKNVRVSNPYFTNILFTKGIKLLTERGWMSDAQVRRSLARLRLSPRLAPAGVG